MQPKGGEGDLLSPHGIRLVWTAQRAECLVAHLGQPQKRAYGEAQRCRRWLMVPGARLRSLEFRGNDRTSHGVLRAAGGGRAGRGLQLGLGSAFQKIEARSSAQVYSYNRDAWMTDIQAPIKHEDIRTAGGAGACLPRGAA